MSVPRLGLVTDVRRQDYNDPFLRALADWCQLVAWHPGLPVDAVFILSALAPRAAEAARAVNGPVALWVTPYDPPSEGLRAKATVIVGVEEGDVRVPAPGIDLRQYRAVAPFLRERWRNKFSITVPIEMPPGLSWRQRRTFLALCPALAATGFVALEALAFATPLVTDSETQAWLGGSDGVDVLVQQSPRRRREVAIELGSDQRRAAAMGRAGRRLAELRHDLAPAAEALADALWLPRRGDLVSAHLADLPAPPLARPFTRAAARIGELSVA